MTKGLTGTLADPDSLRSVGATAEARRIGHRRLTLIPAGELPPRQWHRTSDSEQRTGALQIGRRHPARRKGAVADDHHLRVTADAGLVADGLRDVLHQGLEVLALDASLEVREPARRIGGRLSHAMMVQGVAVSPDSEFTHASLLRHFYRPSIASDESSLPAAARCSPEAKYQRRVVQGV